MTRYRLPCLALITVCLGISLFALVRNGLLAHASYSSAGNSETSSLFPATQRESGPVQMIRFTLFPDGIFPRERRVQAGLLNIAIEDRTGGSAGLEIERITGGDSTPVGTVRRIGDHPRGRHLIRMPPGRYRILDGSRRGNRALLIVEP